MRETTNREMSSNHRTLTEPKSKINYRVQKEHDGETVTIVRIYRPAPDFQFYETVEYSIKPSELSMKLLDVIYRHYSNIGNVPLDRNVKTTVKMTPKLASIYRELMRSFADGDSNDLYTSANTGITLPTYETITEYIIEIDNAYRKQQQEEGGY